MSPAAYDEGRVISETALNPSVYILIFTLVASCVMRLWNTKSCDNDGLNGFGAMSTFSTSNTSGVGTTPIVLVKVGVANGVFVRVGVTVLLGLWAVELGLAVAGGVAVSVSTGDEVSVTVAVGMSVEVIVTVGVFVCVGGVPVTVSVMLGETVCVWLTV